MRVTIIKMIDEFESKTNEKPKNLYVGWDTWEQMKVEFPVSGVYLSSIVKGARPQCYGLLVYVVDAAEHLNVG